MRQWVITARRMRDKTERLRKILTQVLYPQIVPDPFISISLGLATLEIPLVFGTICGLKARTHDYGVQLAISGEVGVLWGFIWP